LQALAEVEEMKQSLLRRSLTGEVQVMELEEAYKQVSARRLSPECSVIKMILTLSAASYLLGLHGVDVGIDNRKWTC
jgi:hypothetical protein